MLAYVAALVSFLALIAYGVRVGNLIVEEGTNWPDRVLRMFVLALLGFLSLAFLDVARTQDGLLLRQWPVFGCLLGITVAGLWPRRKS